MSTRITSAGLPGPLVRFFSLFFLVAGLAACGGGGGGSSGDELITRQPVSLNTLSLSVSPTAFTDQAPATVMLHLTDPAGNPVAGQAVVLHSGDTARLADNQVTTGADGRAITRLFATATGQGVLSARFQDANGSGAATARYRTRVGFAGGPVAGSGEVSLKVRLVDAAGRVVGTTGRPVTRNRPGVVRAVLTSASGKPMANEVIAFETDIGQLDPATGTALTDSEGVATVALLAGSKAGAGTLVATYSGGDDPANGQVSFRTLGDAAASGGGDADMLIGSDDGAGGFLQGTLRLPATQMGVGSSLSVTAHLVYAADGAPVLSPVAVTFASSCQAVGRATIDPVTTYTVGGAATVNYIPDNGCSRDTITASIQVAGTRKVARSAALTVIQSPPGAISFLAADPPVLGLEGSSQAGTQEISTLRFLVKDDRGDPVGAGTQVHFQVKSKVGGFHIIDSTGTGTGGGIVVSTDSGGIASVRVQSGSVPFVAGVTATLENNPAISSTGTVLIQSGVISQNRFTISVDQLNPPAGNHPGTEVKITVRAADRMGNWVHDGTRIAITSELGYINDSCTLENGACSVTWISQGPRSTHYDSQRASQPCFGTTKPRERRRKGLLFGPGCGANDRFGRSTILATAIGEEGFIDDNGNNLYDLGEQATHLAEAFRDDNETGLFDNDPGRFSEEFVDSHEKNGQYDVATAQFRGVGCSDAAHGNGHCADLATVRASSLIVLSTDSVRLYVYDSSVDLSGARWVSLSDPSQPPRQWGDAVLSGPPQLSSVSAAGGEIVVLVADRNGNAPPTGTVVEFDAGDLELFGPDQCVVGNRTEPKVCVFSYGPPTNPSSSYPPMVIKTTSNGVVTSRVISVTP